MLGDASAVQNKGFVMGRVGVCAAIAVAGLASANANAGFILVDGFDGPDMQVFDLSADGAANGVTSATVGPVDTPANEVFRTVTHTLLQGSNASPPGLPGSKSSVKIGGLSYPAGSLSVNNAPGRNSIVEVDWSIPANFLPLLPAGFSGTSSITMNLLFDDLNATASFYLGNAPLGSVALPDYDGFASGSPVVMPVGLALSAAQWNSIAGGGASTLRMVLTGAADWDMTLGSVGFDAVPEPGSLVLSGLALIGMAALRRRRVPTTTTRFGAAL